MGVIYYRKNSYRVAARYFQAVNSVNCYILFDDYITELRIERDCAARQIRLKIYLVAVERDRYRLAQAAIGVAYAVLRVGGFRHRPGRRERLRGCRHHYKQYEKSKSV